MRVHSGRLDGLGIVVALTLSASFSPSTLAATPGPDSQEQLEFFEAKIRPVLIEHCYRCHNSADSRDGGLALDFRDGFLEGGTGRDHNPMGFSIWMAGAGIKGGTIYGATDELGYYATEGRCEVYDLWATVLHLLGINHEKLTFRHGGRDHRLTDVHGRILNDILS